jgi:RecA-family ATPase
MTLDNNKLDAQVERLDRIREQSAGVQRFMKASRHIGEDNALDGPQWLIPGLLQEGQTAICAGPPGTGKSFVILDWLARVVRGLDFCGKPVMQGGVVYTTGEGQTGLAKRVAAVATEFQLSHRHPFLYIRTMPRLLDVQDTKDFIAAVKLQTADWAVAIRLMAFDTFNRAIVGGSESEGKDVARLLHADNQIKDAFGCATLYAHHPGKAEGNDLRGHSSLMGDTDVAAVFSGTTGTRTIEIRKQKDD